MTNRPQAGVLRRLAAIFYDGLLVVAIWLIASALPLLFNRGEALAAGNPLMTLYLAGVTFLFFGWFWTHGGQTVGMRAWRMRLERSDGTTLSWGTALGRFLTAVPAWGLVIFGVVYASAPAALSLPEFLEALPSSSGWLAGLVWLVLDSRPGAWRERLSATRVVVLPRGQRDTASTDAS